MIRLKLTLAYDGTGFRGWQLQKGDPTIQGAVEAAVARIVGRRCPVQGAGRTDTGVHAMGQVAHVDVPRAKAHTPWQRALNCLLPPAVAVLDVAEAPIGFHARLWAVSKVYAYSLWTERRFVLPQRRPFVWDCGPLNLDALDQATSCLVGTHDFQSFQNAGTPVRHTVRSLTRVWRTPGPTPYETVLRFEADGFLKQMVRNLTGCLVEVARGKVPPQSVRSILDERDRTAAPATAPARGLCLESVEYGTGGRGGHQNITDE